MRRLLAFLLLVVAWPVAAQATVEVSVTRQGDGWTADYRFDRRAPAWLFVRSALTRVGEAPWRPQSWRVATPGVRLARRGHYDVLESVDGRPLPMNVRIAFTPFTRDLIADYDPALVFTDGSVALYSEPFVALPLASAEDAEELPQDLNGVEFPEVETRLTFRDAGGEVLHGGRRLARAVLRDDDGDGTYIFFGPARPLVTEAMAAVIDPALPQWIRAALVRSVPDIMARYAAALGPAPGPVPTIFVSWAGPTSGLSSMGGSTLQGMIVMTYEGEGVVAENVEARQGGLWFIAHEAAHFWLGNAVRYRYSREAWITEGGADLLAIRMVAAVDPTYDGRAALNRAIAECIELAEGAGVESAEERNEHRAYYACGAVFGLVAEAASRRPFVEFVRALLDGNRADRTVGRAEWLAALDRGAGDPSLSRAIERLLDEGAEDPGEALADLFTRAGIAFTRGEDGVPVLS